MKKIALFLIGIFLVNALIAQKQLPLQKADSVFKKKDYVNSIQLYNKALKKAKVEETQYINFQLGECYRFGNNFNEALKKYQKSINAGYDAPIVHLRIGEMQLKTGDYETAKTHIEQYVKAVPSDNLAAIRLESCNLGLKGETEKPLYEISNEKTLNSSTSDYGIAYFKNGKVIFASTRLEGSSKIDPYTSQGFSNMYESFYDQQKAEWSKAEKLRGGINSNYNEGTFTYDQVTNTGFYMQCNGESGKKLNCSILCSNFNDNNNSWESPKIFEFNSPDFSVGHPSITSDGKTMYFVSDMPGGIGGTDIYVIKKNGEVWGQPENLGNTINTIGDDMFPFVSGDSILVFASDGHPGFGGLDLYISQIKKGKFTKPVNMMPPINSSADDFTLIFKNTENEGYFCSNRPGGVGDDDVYSYKLVPVLLSASGTVKDKTSGKNINDAVVLFIGDDESVDSVYTNSKGKYEFDKINENTKYSIKVYKTGYLNDSKTLSVEEEKYSKEFNKSTGYDLDFELIKITKEEVKIDNIYYDYDKANLRSESKLELDKLVNILKETPDVKLQINAHTDERGARDYNIELSQRRAQSVVDYLILKGISFDRLLAKGYGFSTPLVKKAKTEEQHQLNRRTTFKILNSSAIGARNTTYTYVQPIVPTTTEEITENTENNYAVNNHVTEETTVENTTTTTSTTTTTTTPEIITKNKTPLNTNTNSKTELNRFFIIAASYSTEGNAIEGVNALNEKGFNSEIVGKNNTGKWRISYNSFPSREEAAKALIEIRKSTNPSAWIFEKK